MAKVKKKKLTDAQRTQLVRFVRYAEETMKAAKQLEIMRPTDGVLPEGTADRLAAGMDWLAEGCDIIGEVLPALQELAEP